MEEEDLEEMKYLRDAAKRYSAIEKRATTGYKFTLNTNKPKLAKDLAGFKVDVASKGGDDVKVKDSDEDDEVKKEIQEVMGFAGFGRVKEDLPKPIRIAKEVPKARQFPDLEMLVKEATSVAKEITGPKWKNSFTKEASPPPSSMNDGDSNEPVNTDGNKNSPSESEDEEFVGPPLPPGFEPPKETMSSEKSRVGGEAGDDDEIIGPPLPPGFQSDLISEGEAKMPEKEEKKSEANEDDEDDEDDEEAVGFNRYDKIPASLEIELTHGSKTVSALALDPNGSRLVSGGYDYEVRYWDFQGMDSKLQSFRTVQPCECYPIKNLEYSPNGDLILVIAGNSQAKLIDRDGFIKMECNKGDQYIRDMVNTKGHTAMLNGGCWHPRERGEFMTCSNDGTVRIWNTENQLTEQRHVIKCRTQGGLKATPSAVNYSKDGLLIISACTDGSIQAWDHRRKLYVNNSFLIRNAHQNGTETSSLCFSYDGKYFASRGMDETLKLWDIRNYKTPIKTVEGLFNRFAHTDCSFSPDDKLILTGVSLQKGEDMGTLKFFNRDTFELHGEMKIAPASVIRSMWHPKLNQIIVSTSNGIVKVYYDEKTSDRGAKLCVIKTKRRYKDSFEMTQPQILTPHSLPLFKQEKKKSLKVEMMKARKDPVKSRRPELPITGPGQGGRLASAGSTYASFMARKFATRNKKIDDNEDPREALLKHAKKAAEDPYWVAPAYSATQPKPIYQEVEDQEDDDYEPPTKK